jgi:hypothetical protein
MKLTWTKWSALPAAVLIAGSVAMAQDQPAPSPAKPATPATTPAPAAKPKSKPKPTVAQHKENQQDRIAQGVKKPPLAVRSAFERRQLNGQQSQLSRQMYKDNHNVNTAGYGNSKMGKRQLTALDTAGETAKLENQQKGTIQQVKADRAANGGKLITGEKQLVNKQQNVASKSIYNKKHNTKTQPQAKPQQ